MPPNVMLACGWAAAEADDVAVGILNVKVFGAPRGSRKRLEDRDTVGDALRVERFDTVDTRRGVEMLIVAPVATPRLALGRFLQVQFQPVQMSDGIETVPWFAERKAELPVIRDRAPKVVDEELRSE